MRQRITFMDGFRFGIGFWVVYAAVSAVGWILWTMGWLTLAVLKVGGS